MTQTSKNISSRTPPSEPKLNSETKNPLCWHSVVVLPLLRLLPSSSHLPLLRLLPSSPLLRLLPLLSHSGMGRTRYSRISFSPLERISIKHTAVQGPPWIQNQILLRRDFSERPLLRNLLLGKDWHALAKFQNFICPLLFSRATSKLPKLV